MAARPRSWWQKARKPLEVLGIAVVCMLVMALLVAIVSILPSPLSSAQAIKPGGSPEAPLAPGLLY